MQVGSTAHTFWRNFAYMRSVTVDGHRCREQREVAGLTQAELAAKIRKRAKRNCQPATIAHIELGSRQPSAGMFLAMCKALGVDRESLLLADQPDRGAA